jgi:hypothetical protein
MIVVDRADLEAAIADVCDEDANVDLSVFECDVEDFDDVVWPDRW